MNHTSTLPRTVWALGFVSLLMDTSSEMIHSLLPIFLVTQLGVSALVLGVIEGLAEGLTLFVKTFSGILSDYLRKRKLLIVLGYGLAALTKPLFALSVGLNWIIFARLADRFGKGIRGAPRDALIADITHPQERGAAYGLRQALDTLGAVLGPSIAMIGMLLLADNFHAVFAIAIIPAFLCVLILVSYVNEPTTIAPPTQKLIWPLQMSVLRQLPKAYWWVFFLGFILTLARFSEAFLILRAETLGLSLALTPLVLVLMSITYTIFAYPMGKWSDKVGRRHLLIFSLLLLILADVILAMANSVVAVMFGVAIWGIHLAASQGILNALIADTAPQTLRATAFGLFSLSSGIATLFASVIAGALWVSIGASSTFWMGAGLAGLTLLLLLLYKE